MVATQSRKSTNSEFELQGVNHIAMVCKDMRSTVDFYTNVLGMPLVRTLDLPGGMGQHFFFDMGGGQLFAFFWFPDAPERQPSISSPRSNIDPVTAMQDPAGVVSSHSSMNHFAFNVAPAKIVEYREKLIAKGVQVSSFMHHDASPSQLSETVTESVWISSFTSRTRMASCSSLLQRNASSIRRWVIGETISPQPRPTWNVIGRKALPCVRG